MPENILEKMDRFFRYVDPVLALALKVLFFLYLALFVAVGMVFLAFSFSVVG